MRATSPKQTHPTLHSHSPNFPPNSHPFHVQLPPPMDDPDLLAGSPKRSISELTESPSITVPVLKKSKRVRVRTCSSSSSSSSYPLPSHPHPAHVPTVISGTPQFTDDEDQAAAARRSTGDTFLSLHTRLADAVATHREMLAQVMGMPEREKGAVATKLGAVRRFVRGLQSVIDEARATEQALETQLDSWPSTGSPAPTLRKMIITPTTILVNRNVPSSGSGSTDSTTVEISYPDPDPIPLPAVVIEPAPPEPPSARPPTLAPEPIPTPSVSMSTASMSMSTTSMSMSMSMSISTTSTDLPPAPPPAPAPSPAPAPFPAPAPSPAPASSPTAPSVVPAPQAPQLLRDANGQREYRMPKSSFLGWLKQMETATRCSYVGHGALVNISSKRATVRWRQYWHCHRSGSYTSRATTPSTRPTWQTKKCGCTSKIYVRERIETPGVCDVTWHYVHVGHDPFSDEREQKGPPKGPRALRPLAVRPEGEGEVVAGGTKGGLGEMIKVEEGGKSDEEMAEGSRTGKGEGSAPVDGSMAEQRGKPSVPPLAPAHPTTPTMPTTPTTPTTPTAHPPPTLRPPTPRPPTPRVHLATIHPRIAPAPAPTTAPAPIPAPQHRGPLTTTRVPNIRHQPAPKHPAPKLTPAPMAPMRNKPVVLVTPAGRLSATRRAALVATPPPAGRTSEAKAEEGGR
ncbi:hypothetical protein BC938DRAFT_471071 [Jimgerdemannia flammicorona]|uniref:Uncharacterized protein n=1 Tax=Jimgerdemannia flammicorona TaxID=994334 RepID=A0A433Q8U8_9FUNG|nr:hypothetical protein BC938DRAFT_471071 [Jimgerdemannia flammicorona]